MNAAMNVSFQKKKIWVEGLILLFLAIVFFSCKGTEDDLISTDTIKLYVVSGNNQTAQAGSFLLNPVVLKLGLSSGIGLPDKIVTISLIKGGGEINNKVDTTDSNGLIKIQWKMGYEPGEQQLKISSQGVNDLILEATAAAKPGKIELISGDNQSAYNGDTLLLPIVVAVKDSLDNPIKGRTVKADVSGGGKLIPSEKITDENGEAAFKWIVGPELNEQHALFLAGTSNSVEASVLVSKAPSDQEIVIFNNTKIEVPSLTVTVDAALPSSEYNKIEAVLELTSPCLSCDTERDPNCDPWDRIGFVNIDAKTPGGGTIQLELLRFITPFGNSNTYVQDVSQFAPLLTGKVRFNAYISTYEGHWNITFKLRFKKATLNNGYFMASPVIFDDAMFSYEEVQALDVDLPENNGVILTYFTTGHNSQGKNCDEFCEKVNEIYIDNKLVESFTPWRTDCEDFAEINKCEGSQTLTYDRAGWCPGDIVRPHIFNVGELSAGKHIFKIHVVNIEDNGGYWRTSLSVIAKK